MTTIANTLNENALDNSFIDVGRRRFLVRSTSTLLLAGAAATAVPFLASWQPTAAAKIIGAPVSVDLSKIAVGEGVKFLWRGMPMWVIRRSAAVIEQLPALRERLKDPDSIASVQPTYANNELRARRADITVLTAVCTHLSCIPDLRPKGDGELGPGLEGGFFCACHGSRFDTAGRVLKGSPAPINLPVPAYYFADDNTLVIGVDSAPE